MNSIINRYVDECRECARNKSRRDRPHGFLQPLPIPDCPFGSVPMDHTVKLPVNKGECNCILIVVDQLTKMAHFIPTKETNAADKLSQTFIQRVFLARGLPDDIISDCGTQFTLAFWHRLTNPLGSNPS